MENGWVYWSNKGLTDVASGIQLQRGLELEIGSTISRWNCFNFTKAAGKKVVQYNNCW